MNRLGLLAVGRRAVMVAGFALLVAVVPSVAAAQEAAPAQQDDPLLFKSASPILLVNQIKAEKAADFESAWAEIRAAFAKVNKPEVKAFGETLNKMYKVDLPAAGGAVIYIFQLDAPSTAFSYNPVKILFEAIQKNEGMTYDEANAIYNKLKDAYQSINPWPIVKIG
jgi:hypothetical protein